MNNQEKSPKTITPNVPLWTYQIQQNSKLAIRSRKDLEVQLIIRCLKDELFKQELMNNPKAVIEKEIGIKLPDELKYNLLKETETTVYIVLPGNPYEGLTEAEIYSYSKLTLEDIAQWVFEQQINTVLNEVNSVQMIAEAWKNEVFKQELLSKPKVTLADKLGILVPESFDIQVVSESCDTLYLVLPCESHLYTRYWYLSDVEMENVAHAEGQLLFVLASCYPDLTNCTNISNTCVCK